MIGAQTPLQELWIKAIAKYENGGKRLSPFEGSMQGFAAMIEAASLSQPGSEATELMATFAAVFVKANPDAVTHKLLHWTAALGRCNAWDRWAPTRAGMEQCQADVRSGDELAQRVMAEFAKSVMKA